MHMFRGIIFGFAVALSANAADTGTLSLKLTALDPSVKAGNRIIVQVTTTNNSDREITYRDTRRDCDYSVRVLTSTGAPVPETTYKKQLECGGGALRITGREIVVTLKPGESKSDRLNVSELFNMAQPGDYSISVSRTFAGIGQFSANTLSENVHP